MKSLYKILLLVSSVSLVSGCSTLGVGKSDFDCGAENGQTKCGVSARTLYEVSEGTNSKNYQDSLVANELLVLDDTDVKKTKNQNQELAKVKAELELYKSKLKREKSTSALPTEAVPEFVLKKSEVIRIWIAPWIDDRNILNTGGFKYAEINEQKWNIGNQISNSGNQVQLKPYQIIKPAQVEVDGQDNSDKPSIDRLLSNAKEGVREALQ